MFRFVVLVLVLESPEKIEDEDDHEDDGVRQVSGRSLITDDTFHSSTPKPMRAHTAPGVWPSPATATLAGENGIRIFQPALIAGVAAPEDGRTS